MEKTLKKLDSMIRLGFSPNISTTLDGIGYQYTISEMRNSPSLYDEIRDVRDRKKFDDDDELCNCIDPCFELNQVDITTLRRRRRVPSMGTNYEDYIPLQDLEPDIHLDETLDELTPLMKVSRFRARNNDLTSVVIDPPSSTNPITLQNRRAEAEARLTGNTSLAAKQPTLQMKKSENVKVPQESLAHVTSTRISPPKSFASIWDIFSPSLSGSAFGPNCLP